VDRERGVYKAPVNETIQGITDIGAQLTKADQVRVNAEGINALRYFSGEGLHVWGPYALT